MVCKFYVPLPSVIEIYWILLRIQFCASWTSVAPTESSGVIMPGERPSLALHSVRVSGPEQMRSGKFGSKATAHLGGGAWLIILTLAGFVCKTLTARLVLCLWHCSLCHTSKILFLQNRKRNGLFCLVAKTKCMILRPDLLLHYLGKSIMYLR